MIDRNELNLTAAEAEILFACCTLAIEQDAFIAEQLKLEKNTEKDGVAIYQDDLASDLFVVFKDGKEGVASNQRKAEKYFRHSNPDKTTEPGSLSTETIYTFLSWYTSTRIFFLRFAHAFKTLFKTSLIPGVFKFLGLSYLVEFLFDLGVCIKNTILPSGEMEKKLPWTTRFVNSLKKDNRGWRMLNALGWTLFNGALALFTGGLSLIAQASISITGFTFDVLLECGKWIDVKRHQNLLDKLDKKIKETAEKIHAYEIVKPKNIQEKMDYEALKKEYEAFPKIRHQVEKKLGEVKKNRQFLIGITVAVLVCMTLVTLPFGGHIVVGLATLATLAIGSVYTGFGRRIFDLIKNKFFPKEKKLERNEKLTSRSTNLSIKRSLDTDAHANNLESPKVKEGIEKVQILATCAIDEDCFVPHKTKILKPEYYPIVENRFALFKANEDLAIKEKYFMPVSENVGTPTQGQPSTCKPSM